LAKQTDPDGKISKRRPISAAIYVVPKLYWSLLCLC
jgi:hypothetical protein